MMANTTTHNNFFGSEPKIQNPHDGELPSTISRTDRELRDLNSETNGNENEVFTSGPSVNLGGYFSHASEVEETITQQSQVNSYSGSSDDEKDLHLNEDKKQKKTNKTIRSNSNRRARVRRLLDRLPFNQKGYKPATTCLVNRKKPRPKDQQNQVCFTCILNQSGFNYSHDDLDNQNETTTFGTFYYHRLTQLLIKMFEYDSWHTVALTQALALMGVDFNVSKAHTLQFLETCYYLMRANTFTDYLVTFAQYLRTFASSFSLSDINNFVTKMMESLPFNFQEEDFGQILSKGIALTSDALTSPVLRWLRVVITATLSIPFLNNGSLVDTFRRLTLYDEEVLKSKSVAPLITDCLQSLQGLFGVYSSYISGDCTLSECIQRSNPYANFNSRYAKVMRFRSFLTCGKTDKNFMNKTEYMQLLTSVINDGELILKSKVSHLSSVRSLVTNCLKELRGIEVKLLNQLMSDGKPAAFILVIVGNSGAGKSVLAEMAQCTILRALGLEYDRGRVANVNTDSKWQDGVDNSKTGIHIEELGTETYFAMQSGGGQQNSTKLVLYYGDSNVQLIDRSDVEEKGRHVNNNLFVTANTNFFDINASHMTKCPAAVYRRITFCEVRVKEEFRAENSMQSDYDKIKHLPDTRVIYDIRFVTVPTSSSDGSMPFVKDNYFEGSTFSEWMSVQEWTAALTVKVKEHFARQELRRVNVDRNFEPFCEHDTWRSLCNKCNIVEQGLTEHYETSKLVYDIGRNCFESTLFGMALVAYFSLEYFTAYFRWSVARQSLIHLRNEAFKRFKLRTTAAYISTKAYFRKPITKDVDMWHIELNEDPTHVIFTWVCSLLLFLFSIRIFRSLYNYLVVNELRPQGVVMSSIPKVSGQAVKQFAQETFDVGRLNPFKIEREYKCHYTTLSFDLSPSKMPMDHLRNNVKSNVIHFTDGSNSFFGTGLKSNFVLINYHNFLEGQTFRVGRVRNSDLHHLKSIRFDRKNIILITSDLAILYMPSHQCRDITQNMLKSLNGLKQSKAKFRAEILDQNSDNNSVDLTFESPRVSNSFTKFDNPLSYNYPHYAGLCGTPIIATIGNCSAFVGIHCAGSQSDPMGACGDGISLAELGEKLDLFIRDSTIEPIANQGSMRRFEVDGEIPIVGKPSSKSIINWRGGNVDYLGTIKNLKYSKIRPKMNFLPTSDKLEEITLLRNKHPSGEFMWQIPDFSEHPSDLEPHGFYSPYHKFADKAFTSGLGLDFDLLTLVLEDYKSDYSPVKRHRISPLDFDSVVSGDSLNRSIRSMNLKASMGFGFDGCKIDYTHHHPIPQAPDGHDFNDDVWSEVNECLQIYLKGETVNPINKASLKVEPRPTHFVGDAVVTKQPRVFCATPNADVLIGRAFLLPIMEYIKSELSTFGCCVGINATSEDWGKIRSLFSDRLQKTFGADISGFDTRMPLQVKVIANSIIIDLAKQLGYNQNSITVLRGYLTDTLEPVVLMKDDLYRMPNLIVSGRVCTAEYNSLCLTIIYRYMFYYMRGSYEKGEFSKNISLVVYGDDSKCGSDVPWFNQQSFADACNVFGIKVTPPDKSDNFGRFFDFDDVEFLHRLWRYDRDHKNWCAPLSMSSMARSLTLNNVSTIGPTMQAYEACHSINFELAQHGREVFDLYMPGITKLVNSLNCGSPRFKTYDEIISSCYAQQGGDKEHYDIK